MEDEGEALGRARSGDGAAFAELFEPCRERLGRYLATMLGDEAAAEDLVQETFQRSLAGIAAFEGRARLSTWLYQIATNLARNWLRDRATHEKIESPTRIEEGAKRAGCRRGVLSTILRREVAGAIAGAIEDLPPILREAFVLRYVEGLEYEEMAGITGATVGALHVRAHRARTLLRSELGPVVDTSWRKEAP